MTGYSDNQLSVRRIGGLTAGLVALGLIFGVRLVLVQIVDHHRYASAATQEHQRKYQIPAHRGQLYLQDGDQPTPLALNQQFNIIYADPTFVVDKVKTAQALTGVTGDAAAGFLAALNRPGEYAVLKTRVPDAMAAQVRALALPGIATSARDYRVYPEGQLAGQLTGFTNNDGVGQYGVEGFLNQDLTGQPGQLAAKTDTYGIPIATANNVTRRPVNGDSFVLTIDRNIQAQAEKNLADGVRAVGAESGSVVVLDPLTGAIKALANFPTYDPNNYGQVSDYNLFGDAVVNNSFEPGSGFKVITMAAGLDSGKVKPDTTYTDTGTVGLPGGTIHNADNHKFGLQTMMDVIQKSINTGAVFVLEMLGGDPTKVTPAGKKLLHDYITKRFGFGVITGVEQAGEQVGVVNPPTTNDLNYANMTFGQGISVTMMQMVTAVTAIANGGKLLQPHLVASRTTPAGVITLTPTKIINPQVISTTTTAQLTTMMEAVVEHGSGYATRIKGYKVAGKTGTAQIPLPAGGYDPSHNIGSFVGFAPAGSPRFVMMVRINSPKVSGFAESTTVPIFAKIAQFILQYYAVPPTP